MNRREGAEVRGSAFQTLKDLAKLRRKRRKKRKNKAEALSNHICDRFLHHSLSFFVRSSFIDQLVFILFYAPLGVPFCFLHLHLHSSTISELISLCKVSFNQSFMS